MNLIDKLIGKAKQKKKEIGLGLTLLTAGVVGAGAQNLSMDSLQNYKLQEDTTVKIDTNYFEKDFSGWGLGNGGDFEESEKESEKEDKKEEVVFRDTTINVKYFNHDKEKNTYTLLCENFYTFDGLGKVIEESVLTPNNYRKTKQKFQEDNLVDVMVSEGINRDSIQSNHRILSKYN
jgi:hypothetical protein